jgi:hypothetical protein
MDQFTAKTLNRQAKKATKDEGTEKARLKKVLVANLIHSNIIQWSDNPGSTTRQQRWCQNIRCERNKEEERISQPPSSG